MPKVTEAYLEERRQQILDAAIVCFARKGFYRTTMEDIGREAGLSHTVAYRYFEGKEDIIVATVQRSADRSARIYDAATNGEDIPLLLERMIDDFYQRLEEPGGDVYYKARVQLWAEALQSPKVAEEAGLLREEGLEQFAAIIRKGQERGQIDPNLDAMAVSVAFAAIHDGFVLHWLADPDVDIHRFREAHLAMVRGLFARHE